MRASPPALFGRLVLTLGGEVVQSAFHFGMNVLVVRMLDARDYGIFAIVMLAGGVSLTYVRALLGMPVSLLVSQRRGTRAASAIEVTFGSGALVLSGSITIIVGVLLHTWLHAGALSGGLFVGLWSLRSYLRTTLLAKRLQAYAAVSDVSLALTGAGLTAFFVRAGSTDLLDTVFLILTGANLVAIGVALMLQGEPIRISFRTTMRRRFQSFGRQLAWSAAGTTTANAQAQGQVLLVATLAGPQAYAPIAAMLVLFAPIRLFSVALANMMQPEIATRLATNGPLPGFQRVMTLWILFAITVGGLYGAAAAAALPIMGSAIFEGQPKMMIGVLAWAISQTFLISLVPRILLEILRRFRLAALIGMASAILGIAAAAILLAMKSAAWTLFGNLLAETVILGWSWIAVGQALRAPVIALSPSLSIRPVSALTERASDQTSIDEPETAISPARP